MLAVESPVYTPARFQKTDLKRLLNVGAVTANWSEMGCYKTSTCLWHIEQMEDESCLIVTTLTGKVTFFEMAPHLLPDYEIIEVTKDTDPRDIKPEGKQLWLAHYDLFAFLPQTKQEKARGYQKQLKPLTKALLKPKWDMTVLDEAQYIKNRKAQRTVILKKVKTHHKHIMTGTAFANCADEVWSLCNFLAPKGWSSYWDFRKEYIEEEVDERGYRTVVGVKFSAQTALRNDLRRFGPRRTKDEVFKELPSLYPPISVPVELTPTQRKIYNQMRDGMRAKGLEGLPLKAPTILAQLTRMRQITVGTPKVTRDFYDAKAERRRQEVEIHAPSPKIDALVEIVGDLDGAQVVVFSNFVSGVELARAALAKAGHTTQLLSADMVGRERARAVSDFRQGKAQVFLSTIMLGAESITLTTAKSVIFIDRHWNPAKNSQARSRVWRPGQNDRVQVYYLDAKDTIDQVVEETVADKQFTFETIFGTEM